MTPPIGQVVERLRAGRWDWDWVCQRRIGDEQFVLVWGRNGDRHSPGVAVWRPAHG